MQGPVHRKRDAAGVDHAAQHETVGVELLYRGERHALVRFFTRYRASPEDADDLVQETFLRFSSMDSEKAPVLRPAAYLRTIARNLLRDRAKAANRHCAPLHDPIEDHPILGADECGRLEARDSLKRIEAAIAGMKPRTREIFLAHRVHGLSYAEIAAETGMTIKGVEKQMSKAIARLARLMDRC